MRITMQDALDIVGHALYPTALAQRQLRCLIQTLEAPRAAHPIAVPVEEAESGSLATAVACQVADAAGHHGLAEFLIEEAVRIGPTPPEAPHAGELADQLQRWAAWASAVRHHVEVTADLQWAVRRGEPALRAWANAVLQAVDLETGLVGRGRATLLAQLCGYHILRQAGCVARWIGQATTPWETRAAELRTAVLARFSDGTENGLAPVVEEASHTGGLGAATSGSALLPTAWLLVSGLLSLADPRARAMLQGVARRLRGERGDGTLFLYESEAARDAGTLPPLGLMGFPAGAGLLEAHAPLAREMLILHAALAGTEPNQLAPARVTPVEAGLPSGVARSLLATAGPLYMLGVQGLSVQRDAGGRLTRIRFNPYLAPYEGAPGGLESDKLWLRCRGKLIFRSDRPVGAIAINWSLGRIQVRTLASPVRVEVASSPHEAEGDGKGADWISPPLELSAGPWEEVEVRIGQPSHRA